MEFLVVRTVNKALRPKRLDNDAAPLLSQGCLSATAPCASHFEEGLISPFRQGCNLRNLKVSNRAYQGKAEVHSYMDLGASYVVSSLEWVFTLSE